MADTITLAIDALASAAFIEGGVSIERTDEARAYTEQRKRELIEAIAASQTQAVAAPDHPPMPEHWSVVAEVDGEDILCISSSALSGKGELSEAEEQAVIGMAQHLLAFVGYGLPHCDFNPDDQVELQGEPVAWLHTNSFGGVQAFTIEPPPGLKAKCQPLYTAPQAQPAFQQRVQPWMMACFGAEIAADRIERNHRFLEEALELVQATGCTQSEAHQLVDYVFGRPVGEPAQEAGGVMVTLAALCLANGLDMHQAGETELARIWTKVEAIRAKQAAKPKHSPLPQAQPADALDAARWRSVAHDPKFKGWGVVRLGEYDECQILTGDEANEAIDAAMAASQEGGDAAKAKRN